MKKQEVLRNRLEKNRQNSTIYRRNMDSMMHVCSGNLCFSMNLSINTIGLFMYMQKSRLVESD
ncbi:hypothetical protein HPL003_14145 [Paenibacillus terrae HPL-003]|uniref:Uncharacterized protein n=1 Tax=Paenibacillus terrae (strain HPL-003) TaxID=985665 RepID=G7W0F9_PAETH|nr:hypothetical protein HPL003_14145 [Paenibacillus terrae HPL-003]